VRIEPGQSAFFTGTKCKEEGVLIAEIYPRSAFQYADPPVRKGDFMVSMNGVALDMLLSWGPRRRFLFFFLSHPFPPRA
jgi:hypothetical protein